MLAVKLEQHPDEDLTHEIDFDDGGELGELLAADPIATAAVIGGVSSPTGLTITAAGNLPVTGTVVRLRLAGGTANTTYRCEVKATTQAGLDAVVVVDVLIARPY